MIPTFPDIRNLLSRGDQCAIIATLRFPPPLPTKTTFTGAYVVGETMIFLIDAEGIEDHGADLPEGSCFSLAMIPAAVPSCSDGSWVTVVPHEAPAELFR